MLRLLLAAWMTPCYGLAASGVINELTALKLDARQVLWVGGANDGKSAATLYALERSRGDWRVARGPVSVVVGRGGIARPEEKREGDGMTPSGVYALTQAFGYAPAIKSRMPYRQATQDDVWVDDPESPDYNLWVKQGATTARSFERMRRADDRYKAGLVVAYNTDPVIKGKGSAIFVHIWKEAGAPTAGCVAMAEPDLLKLLAWLDPAKKPVIVIRRATAK